MFKNVNYSLIFLGILIARAALTGASVGDAIALAAVAALYGFQIYVEANKTIAVNDNIKRDIDDLKSSVNGLKVARAFTRT